MRTPLAFTLPITGVDAATGVDLGRRAEEWGYDACWAAEVQGPDAFTTLAALAVTTDLDLGVAVVPAQTRSAMVLGMTAVSLAELSHGRFSLGIGASSPVIVSQWAGRPFDRPLAHVRETVEALRPVLRGERSTLEGEVVQMHGYRPHATPPEAVPLFLGALNQQSLKMVGELGVDGLCLNQMAVHHVKPMLDRVREGAGGDLPDDFEVVARLFCLVTDDVAGAREVVKHVFAPYVATSVYNRFYRWMGYEEEAAGVAEADGDRAAMAEAMSDRLVEDIFCIGDAQQVTDKIAAFVEAGVTVPVVAPLANDLEGAEHTMRAVAEAWS